MVVISRTAVVISERGVLDGYRVRKGDRILCADGSFRTVEKAEKMMGLAYSLKGHGHPCLVVADNQRILATSYRRKENKREFKPFSFLPPADMKGCFWASTRIFNPVTPELTPQEAWLCGLTLATGQITADSPLNFTLHLAHEETLTEALQEMKLRFATQSRHTQIRYEVDAPKLMDWLRKNALSPLGRRGVPLNVLASDTATRRAFFEGYTLGKGTVGEEAVRFSMDNKVEAITLKLLAQSIFLSTALYVSETRKEDEVRERWSVVAEKVGRSSVEVGRNRWGLVREVQRIPKPVPLMEIVVEGEHSLLVDGIVFK